MKRYLFFALMVVLSINLGIAQGQEDEEVVILETPQGNLVIEFFSNDAPSHVDNFKDLVSSGFYDNTIFHRIIKDFMIQGGDPKTRPDGTDQSEWGTGDPGYKIDAEFNDIKHNRGIVSMARSADPNSGGSQFFIVHKNSNYLDGQYTVFGRLATQESFDTLDKIANSQTGSRDIPTEPETVKIITAKLVNKNEIQNLIPWQDPERTSSTTDGQSQEYQSDVYGISFQAPAGWLLQEPDQSQEGAPNIVAVGPKSGTTNPVISVTITDSKGKSLDDHISELKEFLKPSIESGQLEIISQKKSTINKKEAFVTEAKGNFVSNGMTFDVKFKEIVMVYKNNFYTIAYSNDVNYFDDQLSRFDEVVDSFVIEGEKAEDKETNQKEEDSKGGGCLIATAIYGSELAPQVQQLREIRDNQLLQTNSGTAFITGFNQIYYSFSPTIADLERENPIFRDITRLAITPMITSLVLLNFVDMNSEIEVLGYGVSLILLNIGMYFIVPALIIYKIREKRRNLIKS